MNLYAITLPILAALCVLVIVLNERIGLFASDHFPTRAAKYFAYAWMSGFILLLGALVTSSALAPAVEADLAKVPFYSLFALHAILIVFLAGWWMAAGKPPLREFFNIRTEHPGEVIATGLAVGVGGWVATIIGAVLIATLLKESGLIPNAPEMPAMVKWMASLAIWKKALIVLSAMTVEELFFRAWLQKRVGLIASTALFVLAHFTLGQPLLLIGISVISLVLGTTFYRTRNILPCMIAHGVFDAIQLFVIIPVAMKMLGVQ
jgi:membrane protease YdiL (CAAX protease family)